MKKTAIKTGDKPIDFGFWKKVKKNAAAGSRPILTLAPMADVTDAAFRSIIAKYSRMREEGGGPDVMWTEFVSADGLCSPGRAVLLRDLAFSETERPIVAQLFTSNPEKMKQAAALVARLGFDGVDINMGCPDRSIEKQKAGAAMMKDPENAVAIIAAAREGVFGATPDIETSLGLQNSLRKIAAVSTAGHRFHTPPTQAISARSNSPRPAESSVSVVSPIPVSVKTRIGYNKVEIDSWIRVLLEQRLPALTVHLRTRKEMSDVPAHWELMPEIVRLRDLISPETILIGNGDVMSLEDAEKKVKESGCDGVMFGRAIFGNPWLFDREKVKRQSAKLKDEVENSKVEEKEKIAERLRVMVEHTDLFEKLLGDIKSFAVMKKHYKAYVNGWDGAKELRVKLMDAQGTNEVRMAVDKYIAQLFDR